MRLRTQYLTKNDCYIRQKHLNVRGVMWHSTGANNPLVSRYVPGNAELGVNTNGNHWNMSNVEAKQKFGQKLNKCVHAFIGLFSDGEVGTVQTLPWGIQGWHAGGSANQTHIGFEICEDGLEDAYYFNAVYQESCELTAKLCRDYALDPFEDGVIICHADGYQMGVASNHGDVLHWLAKYGKTMDDVRRDVARLIEGDDENMDAERFHELFLEMRRTLQDNDNADWSQEARQWAIDNGLIAGGGTLENGEVNYMWEDLLTREQMVQLLFRFAKWMGRA